AVNNAAANGSLIILPSISIVEIVYLIEKNRLIPQTLSSLMRILKIPNSSFAVQDLTAEIAQTLAQIPRLTVPDMPDRIIAATALHLNLPLVTKDSKIQALTSIQTIW
ncbi:MAG: type II toxin-antitoxin system VapC family toxin, partial [Pyrinomonadaceae bacterium]